MARAAKAIDTDAEAARLADDLADAFYYALKARAWPLAPNVQASLDAASSARKKATLQAEKIGPKQRKRIDVAAIYRSALHELDREHQLATELEPEAAEAVKPLRVPDWPTTLDELLNDKP